MDGSLSLRRVKRKRLLDLYRRSPVLAVRLRAHLILLLADDYDTNADGRINVPDLLAAKGNLNKAI